MSNKKIYKNRLSLPIFDNKGIGNGNGVAYIPNVIRGGSAIPIGNNMFLMRGRSHAQGGIDIGRDLEVEGNEVVQNGKFGTRVFSSVPFLRGVSPAQRVLQGENPDAVFAAQENWKRINKINDDGSRKARKGKYVTNPNVAQSDNTRVAPILNNPPKSKEIRQGDFIYTPKQLVVDDEKGFVWQPASRQVSQVPLERVYPEFDAFMLPRVAANYATSPILQLERELNKGLKNIKIVDKPLEPKVRTKIGDVEINNPELYYHQSDAGKAKNFVSTGRMRTPLEEFWLAKEEAGERIPIAMRIGFKPGYPQSPGRAMFSQGRLWYGLDSSKPDLLVTAREMPIANKNAYVMSNKASLKRLEAEGTRRVTNDNLYTQGPHNIQNTTAYVWEPGYGYKRVFAEESPTLNWKDALLNATNGVNKKQFGGRKAALGLSLFRPNSFKVQELPIDNFLANSINREIETPEVPTYVLKDDEKPVGKKVNPSIIGGGRLYNGYAVDNHEGENVNGIGGGRVYTAKPIDEFATDSVSFGDIKSPRGFKEQDADYIYDYLSKHSDLTDTAKAAILATAAFESGMNPRAKNKYSTAKGYFQWLDDRYIPTPGLSDEQEKIAQLNKIIDDMTPVKGKAKGWTQTKTRNIFDLANEFRTTDDIDRAVEIITRHHIRPSLGEEPIKNKQGVEVDKGYKWEIAERRKVAKQFYNRMFNRKNKKEFGGMKLNIFKLGGLSRSKDYGSKDKPYPSVNKNDFAGGGRSYPIPTRADAVDALRLAGLHHRSDVRAKVYAKYPDLRKKAAAGTKINEIPNNNDGLVVGDNLSFNQAFGTARRAGFHIFTWRGKKYTTDLADSSVDNNTYEGGTLPNLVVTGNRGRNANTILLREQNEDRINNLNSKSNTSNKKESTKSTTLGDRIKNVLTSSGIGSLFNNFDLSPIFRREARKNNFIRTNVLGRREIPTPGIFDGGEFGGGGAGSRFGYTPKKDKDEEYKFIPVPVSVRRTFNEAFADARKKGLKTFDFNGKKYTTELGNNPKSQSAGNRRFENRLDIALIPIKKKEENKKGTNEDIIKKVNAVIDKHPGFGGGGAGSRFSFGGRKVAKGGIYTPEEIANMTDVELLKRIIDPTTDPLWSRSKYNPHSYNYSFIEDRFSRGKRNKAVEAAKNRLNYLANSNRPSISVARARELFSGDSSKNIPEFYQRERVPIFKTNPLVSRFYNYGWSHNNGRTISPTESLDATNRIAGYKFLSNNLSRGRNTNTEVSPAAQRILDNAEIALYQTFRTPSLTEVASRYPISERINVGTGTAPISSSTGVQPNPTDVEAVRNGNFKAIDNDRYLPIRTTTEDWIGLGANLLGSIGSYLGTRAMLNRYPMPNRPVPAIAQKLKTRVNINPQLDTLREQVGKLNTSIDDNTSSSRVAQARKQGVSNNAVASRNQLYGQKENAETQLINQDIMNRQRIGLYNNQIYNDYLNRLGSTRQYLANARIGNFNNVLSGANQSIQDLLGRIEDRDAERRNFIFMQAAYPNVNWRNIFQGNPELARSLGFRFLNN